MKVLIDFFNMPTGGLFVEEMSDIPRVGDSIEYCARVDGFPKTLTGIVGSVSWIIDKTTDQRGVKVNIVGAK